MFVQCEECGEEFEVLKNEIDEFENIICPECGCICENGESIYELQPGDYGYTGEYDEKGEFIHPCGNSWDY